MYVLIAPWNNCEKKRIFLADIDMIDQAQPTRPVACGRAGLCNGSHLPSLAGNRGQGYCSQQPTEIGMLRDCRYSAGFQIPNLDLEGGRAKARIPHPIMPPPNQSSFGG